MAISENDEAEEGEEFSEGDFGTALADLAEIAQEFSDDCTAEGDDAKAAQYLELFDALTALGKKADEADL